MRDNPPPARREYLDLSRVQINYASGTWAVGGQGRRDGIRALLLSRHRFPADIIGHAVWLYHVFSLSLRDVELILAERGVVVDADARKHSALVPKIRR